ncbi:hypothetical protein [Nostoc sp. GT001]|uniref:hypothetical protein n=1 Tax=Nostoc sp. GT001 TaxID=3056647 RepID=UPI0025AB3268|nr:hypothetical protein [Nostoc sp. GT001]MDM9584290.1 hypothetical protein [Nostoc sp. GT001]
MGQTIPASGYRAATISRFVSANGFMRVVAMSTTGYAYAIDKLELMKCDRHRVANGLTMLWVSSYTFVRKAVSVIGF